MINTSPYMIYSFDEAKQKHITKDGEYITGAYGYISDKEASKATTKFYIEANKNNPMVYLVMCNREI